MARNEQDCLVILQIAARRVAITVAWRDEDGEQVVAHRHIECLWHQLDTAGRRQALHDCLQLGAETAGVEILSVFVALADPTLRANFATGYADLGEQMVMTRAERSLALIRATHQAIGTDRQVLHALPQRWEVRSLDGDREVDDPVGQTGIRLTCHVLLVTMARSALAEIEQQLADMGVHVESVIAQPVGLYRGLRSHLAKRGSTLIIDCGARFTSLLVHRKSRLVHVETHAFGGDDITRALVDGLGLPWERAEAIKREVDVARELRHQEVEGQTYLWREVQERQQQAGPSSRICTDAIRAFFNDRARHLRELELLAQTGRIHLVGRAATLSGLPQVLEDIFKLDVVLGTAKADRDASHEMSDLLTAGLVRQAAIERERHLAERQSSGIRQVTNVASGLLGWLLTPLR